MLKFISVSFLNGFKNLILFFDWVKFLLAFYGQSLERFILSSITLLNIKLLELFASLTLSVLSMWLLGLIESCILHCTCILSGVRLFHLPYRCILREFKIISLGKPLLLKSFLQLFPSQVLAVGSYFLPHFFGFINELLIKFFLSSCILHVDLLIKGLFKYYFPMLFCKIKEILFSLDFLNTRLLRDDIP